MAQRNPDYLYHYTTAEGLISIVQHHELWATNIFYLNDRSELRTGLQLALDCLQTEEAKKKQGDKAHTTAQALARLKSGEIAFKMFVCSFSEDADDLGQWRAYCARGGYAIGFPFESIHALELGHLGWLTRCVYDEHIQREIVETCINSSGADLTVDLIGDSLRFKHVAFLHENEWRLIHIADNTYSGGLFSKYCFRSHNGRVIPYAKIRLDDGATWEKIKVVVGPCPEVEMKESMAAVRYLLGCGDLSGHDRVTSSAIPYRHW
jgi:hypothetical protein